MRVWLKEIRTAAGLSQAKVAKKSGISQRFYCGIERGERGKPLNVNIAKSIAKALNFDWQRFYDDVEPRNVS